MAKCNFWKISVCIFQLLFNFISIMVFDVEVLLESTKLAILELLEFHPSQPLWVGQIRKLSRGKLFGILLKPKCHLGYTKHSAVEPNFFF